MEKEIEWERGKEPRKIKEKERMKNEKGKGKELKKR